MNFVGNLKIIENKLIHKKRGCLLGQPLFLCELKLLSYNLSFHSTKVARERTDEIINTCI